MNAKTIVTVIVLIILTIVAVAGAIFYDYQSKEGENKTPALDLTTPGKQETGINPAAPAEPEEEPEEPVKGELETAFEKEKGSFNLILANVDNPLPDGFDVETEVVQNGFRMDKRVAGVARQMIDDAEADGVDLMLCSGYRSIEKQTSLFEAQKEEYIEQGKSEQEAEELTANAIAIPGTSEHHTGLAADIVTPTYQNLNEGFEDTDAFKWLDENAWKYGFILRFPKDKEEQTKIMYESWHYRYVGKIHAKLIKDSGLCLEEYLEQAVPAGLTMEMVAESEAEIQELEQAAKATDEQENTDEEAATEE